MAARYDALATPGSQYGYTGALQDAPMSGTGFQLPTYRAPNYGYQTSAPVAFESLSSWNAPNYGFDGAAGTGGLGLNPVASTVGLRMPTTGSGFGGGNTVYGPAVTDTTAGGGGSWFDGFLGTRDKQGWGGLAIGGAQALGGLYLGMQQYGLAKDQLAFQKESFNKQYDANRTLTNSRLEDRQKARVASNPGAYESVGDYMAKWGVK